MGVDATNGATGMPAQVANAANAPAPAGGGLGFGDVLSMLNPLQYVPVVGMIYRAVTGDTIPDPVRVAGGLAFSALTGGPVGVVISAGTEVAEEALGISPDKIGHSVLASLGLAAPERAAPKDAASVTVASAAKPAGGQAQGQAPLPAPPSMAVASPAAAPAMAASTPAQESSAADVGRRNLAYAWTSLNQGFEPVVGMGG
jgi:hypothetical protein